jgi:hypothetical protein
MDYPSSPVPSVVVVIACYLFYSARSTEIIISREMAVYKLAKRKLPPWEIFVHFNFGSVFLRYILCVIIPVHTSTFDSFVLQH